MGIDIAGCPVKLNKIEKLIKLVDVILIGGGMAYTFLKAKGVEVGRSLVESDKIILAQDLLKKSKKQGSLIVLPVDHLVVENLRPGASIRSTLVDKTPEESIGVDIGPATCKIFEEKISTAKTIFWNGPLGIFELPGSARGAGVARRRRGAARAARPRGAGGRLCPGSARRGRARRRRRRQSACVRR